MLNNNLFFTSFLLSIAIHAAILTTFPPHIITQAAQKKPIEIYYQHSLPQETKPVSGEYLTEPEVKSNLADIIDRRPPKSLWQQSRAIGDFLRDEIFNKRPDLTLIKKPRTQEKSAPVKMSVKMPEIAGQAIKTPEYKNYYSLIREKIKKYAYYNYKKLVEGEVFLTFTLSSTGSILQLSVDKEKSTNNQYLQNIALKSIKDAVPFPKFPEKLNKHKKLSFNVIISFELK